MRVLYRTLPRFLIALAAVQAQPSGGPDGPIDRRYEAPKAARVYYVAPSGSAQSPGAYPKR
jgi:hypothetical protein